MSTDNRPVGVSALQCAAEARVVNPALRVVLSSRLHALASRWLMLVSYVGRRSGRRHTFPVAHCVADVALLVVTPKREARRWRHFLYPCRCSLCFRGRWRQATGDLLEDSNALDAAPAAYFGPTPCSGGCSASATVPRVRPTPGPSYARNWRWFGSISTKPIVGAGPRRPRPARRPGCVPPQRRGR